jgi:transcriptional regulator GlxA family with amidase domain
MFASSQTGTNCSDQSPAAVLDARVEIIGRVYGHAPGRLNEISQNSPYPERSVSVSHQMKRFTAMTRRVAPTNGNLVAIDARVESVISLMNRLEPTQSICTLSKSVNLTPARLRQLFRKNTGRSPMQYLKDLRMRRAEGLLENTFLSVKEIALLCGVGDVSHFVRDFKNTHGSTPTEYRVQCGR